MELIVSLNRLHHVHSHFVTLLVCFLFKLVTVFKIEESRGLIGIQLPEKYKENFDVSKADRRGCSYNINTIIFIYFLKLFSIVKKISCPRPPVRVRRFRSAIPRPPFIYTPSVGKLVVEWPLTSSRNVEIFLVLFRQLNPSGVIVTGRDLSNRSFKLLIVLL